MPVPLEETDRFGIMEVGEEDRITAFYEKPKDRDKGNLASMGIYVFNTHVLERASGWMSKANHATTLART